MLKMFIKLMDSSATPSVRTNIGLVLHSGQSMSGVSNCVTEFSMLNWELLSHLMIVCKFPVLIVPIYHKV